MTAERATIATAARLTDGPRSHSAVAETTACLVLSQAGLLVCVPSTAHRQRWIGTFRAGLLAGAHLLRTRAPPQMHYAAQCI
ncbi:hypothetical protein WM26_35005 [Burkholderia cepacia]|nr:hypothetical protein WM26_35005 [Burkholderia cepacia]